MYIDSHCHLSVEDYDNIDLVIRQNRENNIGKIIVSGCSKDSILESVELALKYDDVYVTLGYHPSEVSNYTDNDLEELKKLLINNPKVVGLGEIGLDYHYGRDTKDKQIILFEKQLKIAEELGMVVVIHSRDAIYDTINILRRYNLKGVIHCFSGSIEIAKEYIKMGFKLGIGGVVTFKNSNLFKIVEAVGLENIVLETDSPYLTPEPYRGSKNSSKYIPIIARKIADILNIDVSVVEKVTATNTCEMFDLD